MFYPKSFLGLLITGFALVAAPLVIGLVSSALYTDRLAVVGRSALFQAVQVTQVSRRIADLVRGLERSARQFVILGDRSIPEPYLGLRRELTTTATRAVELPFDAEQRVKLDALMAIERAVFEAISKPDTSADALATAIAGFTQANRLATDIIARSDELIDRESQAMNAIAQRAQQVVFWQLAAAVPLAIIVIWGFAIMLARPVRELDQAIGRIGSGKLAAPIDVSGPRDLEQLGRRLEWLRLELLHLEQRKNQFLRHVAHALKTPLAAVRESADLLVEHVSGTLTPMQRELTAILQRNAVELQRLIEDLLQLEEADFRRLQLDLDRVALDQLIAQVQAGHELAARSKRLRIDVQVDESVRQVVADRDKLRVIMDNLLSNAIKHSPVGSTIEVIVRRERETVTIGIRDEGSGIAPEDRDRVFDPFYQGRARGSGVIKGSGVGLSIVREYAIAHGGSAVVADDDRGGAHLCVILPVTQQATEQP